MPLLAEFRGYDGLHGRPAYLGVADDARAAHAHLIERLEIPPASITYFGFSLGTAVATELASEVGLKIDPSTEACDIVSPTLIAPRAWSDAMRAHRPVPVGERSSRPGATATAFFVTAPMPCHGAAICTMLTPAMLGFSSTSVLSGA